MALKIQKKSKLEVALQRSKEASLKKMHFVKEGKVLPSSLKDAMEVFFLPMETIELLLIYKLKYL